MQIGMRIRQVYARYAQNPQSGCRFSVVVRLLYVRIMQIQPCLECNQENGLNVERVIMSGIKREPMYLNHLAIREIR